MITKKTPISCILVLAFLSCSFLSIAQAPTNVACVPNYDMFGNPIPNNTPWQVGTDKLFTHCMKVGIGTTTPRISLDVWGSTYSGTLALGQANPTLQSNNVFYMRAPYSSLVPFNNSYNLQKIFTIETVFNPIFDINRSGMVRIYSGFPTTQNKPVFLIENTDRKIFQIENNGLVRAREILVDLANNWPDYVFEEEYDLMEMDSLKIYLEENNHLPGVPTAEQIEAEGIPLGEMNRILLEKIEELTLYMIEQNEKIVELQKVISAPNTNGN